MAGIEQFCKDNMMSVKMTGNIQLVFEELVMTNIIPKEREAFSLKAEVEYSEVSGNAVMKIKYSGEKFDPFEDGDDVSMMIVKKLTAEHSFEYDDINTISLKFA